MFYSVHCAILNTTTALSFIVDSDGSSTTVYFTCASGYDISGPQTITCLSDGSWSISQPTCCKYMYNYLHSIDVTMVPWNYCIALCASMNNGLTTYP